MPETLLSPSNVLIYGRSILDLKIVSTRRRGQKVAQDHNPFEEPRGGANFFLQNQLNAEGAHLARIYGFSYEGHYYDLSRPALFLVHGNGLEAERVAADPRVARGPEGADRSGVAAQDYSFSDDMRVWSYDKEDLTIKLDMESGSFTDLLLEASLNEDTLQSYYSGAKVSGAKVSGAKVSGAKVSGAKVSGAKVGRGD